MSHPDPFPAPDYTSRFAPSYWEEVGDWFRVVGGAHLRSLTELPDAFDLADWLMEEARRYEPRGLYPGTGWRNVRGMARDNIVDRAEETAEWLLKNHKPKRRSRFTREQSITGGKNSRRPKILLRRYARLMAELEATGELLTPPEIAERLGCARQSVYRLRAQLETTFVDLTPSAETLDSLISQIDPVPDYVPVSWIEEVHRGATVTTYSDAQKLAALLSAIDGNPNKDALQMIAELPAMQAANRAAYEAEKHA